MKTKLYSFLASIIFIPVAILGQFFGRYVGIFLAWFNSAFTFFSMPQFFNSITIGFVSGAFAGWVSAKAVMAMNKNFDFRFAIALPVILVAFAFFGDIYGYLHKYGNFNLLILNLVREVSTIALYVITLKDEAKIVS